MKLLANIKESLLHLAFPHVCAGCGNDVVDRDSLLCADCLLQLPHTQFQLHANNPIETIFTGRLPLTFASAHYYFSKGGLMQQLMHGLKYKGNKELGVYLGGLMGIDLMHSRFSTIDALVPLPLFAEKEKRRGYNQATVICNGIASEMNIPVLTDAVIRTQATETQTKKSRVERWQNMEGRFELANKAAIEGKHILLVDDVVTTGATLEACGHELLKANNVKLSIATLCYSLS
jgi:ComF family protein